MEDSGTLQPEPGDAASRLRPAGGRLGGSNGYARDPDDVVFAWSAAEIDDRVRELAARARRPSLTRQQRRTAAADADVKATLAKLRQLSPRIGARAPDEVASVFAAVSRVARPVVVWDTTRRRSLTWVRSVTFAVCLLAAPLLSTLAWSWWFDSRPGAVLWLIALAELLGVGLVSRCLIRPGVARFAAGTILLGCLVLAVVAVGIWHHADPGLIVQYPVGVATALAIYLVVALTLAELATTVESLAPIPVQPADILLISLVQLASEAASWSTPETESKQQTRQLLRHLEECAVRTERTFPKLAERGDGELRRWARDRGRRAAAVIRAHKRMVVDPQPLDRGAVADSLVNGLIYLSRRDWPAFLVVDPEPPLTSALRKYGPRILLAAVLVTAAFVFPDLSPGLVGGDVGSFRATLIITGIFMLFAPDAGKARDVLTQFMSR